MRYSIEPRDRIYVKGYRFLSFATHLSNKYDQKLNKKKYAIKTTSKRAIQKTEEATGDLIGNKIVDKITCVSKRFSAKLRPKNNESEAPEERYITPEKIQQIIDELRLL